MTSASSPALRLAITAGEPAGIGPDICLAIASQIYPAQLVIVADPEMLAERAETLVYPLRSLCLTGKTVHLRILENLLSCRYPWLPPATPASLTRTIVIMC